MKCKVCGHENQEGSTFCANCGSVLKNEPCTAIYKSRPEEETPHSDNNAAPMAVMTKRKKIIAIVVVCILLFSAPFLINSLLSGGLFHSNVKKYICNAGTDAESYFEVDFGNNTYKYVGSNVGSRNSAFNCEVLVTNLLGCESGSDIFDGLSIFAKDGKRHKILYFYQ